MAQVTLRCSDAELADYKERAHQERLSLNRWILSRLGPAALPGRAELVVDARRREGVQRVGHMSRAGAKEALAEKIREIEVVPDDDKPWTGE